MDKVEEPIADYNQLDTNKHYTYWDYITWKFTDRVELIRGSIRKMSPGPSLGHQSVAAFLSGNFYNYFKNKSCKWFPAPFDVRLPIPNEKKDTTVVQPDLCVICDTSILDERGCNGVPDLVVEILSPGNSNHEIDTKFSLYEEAGVKEYCIVGIDKTVHVYCLQDGKYIGLPPCTIGMMVKSNLFPDLQIDTTEIFE